MRTATLLFALTGLTGFLLAGCEMPEGTDTANNGAAVDNAGDATLDNTGAAPDNTGINERDANSDTLTPLDQGQGEADVDRSAQIRNQVLEIENLSVYGRNVKIITNDGHVTLRGPVASADERAAIEKIAVDVAGAGNVTNELEIAPSE